MRRRSSPPLGRVSWLQPVQRRRRRRLPVVALLLFALLLAAGAGAAWVLLARQAANDRRQDVVERFAAAWTRGDYPAMWRLIGPERRRDWSLAEFAASYRIAAEEATVKSVRAGPVGQLAGDRAPVAVEVRTANFGTLRGMMPLAVSERGGEVSLDWSPAWRLPGLRDGERVRRRVRAPDELEGPLRAGERVGTVTVLVDGEPVRRLALVTAADVPGAGTLRVLLSVLGVPLTVLLVLAILLGAALAALRLRVRLRLVRR